MTGPLRVKSKERTRDGVFPTETINFQRYENTAFTPLSVESISHFRNSSKGSLKVGNENNTARAPTREPSPIVKKAERVAI